MCVDLSDEEKNLAGRDYIKSYMGDEKMKEIDENVAKWMKKEKKGGWEWLAAERLGNKKTKEFYNSIIKKRN